MDFEKERNRGLLYRRIIRQQIEKIELEFKKLKFLVEEFNHNAALMQKWIAENRPVPILFQRPKAKKPIWMFSNFMVVIIPRPTCDSITIIVTCFMSYASPRG